MALKSSKKNTGFAREIERDFIIYNDYTATRQQLLEDRPDPTGPNVIDPRLVAGRSKGTSLPKPTAKPTPIKVVDPAKDARKVFGGKKVLPLKTAKGEQRRKHWADYD